MNPTFSHRNPSPTRTSGDIKQKEKAPFADNPSEGLIPLPVTDVLVKRLTGWNGIVRNIIRYLEIVMEQEKRLAESMSRCIKELSMTNNESFDMFSEDETIQVFIRQVNDAHLRIANERVASVEVIETQVLPILRELGGEIRKKIAATEKQFGNFDREIKTDMDTYITLASHLRNSLMRQQWKGDTVLPDLSKDVPRDPYIADLALKKHIDVCSKKQDYYREQILAEQDSFASFEKVVIQNIRVSLSTFYEWRSQVVAVQNENIKERKTQIESIQADLDWNLFKDNFGHRLIEEQVPLVNPKELTYDGFDDPAVSIVRKAELHRKEGVFKRAYRPCTGILTASSYLHIVPLMTQGEKYPELPELSLDLTECTLLPLMMNENDPEEIAIMEKTSGVFSTREVKHKFKGATLQDGVEWWGVLNEAIRNTAKRTFRSMADIEVPKPAEKTSTPALSPSKTNIMDDEIPVSNLSIASDGYDLGASPEFSPARQKPDLIEEPSFVAAYNLPSEVETLPVSVQMEMALKSVVKTEASPPLDNLEHITPKFDTLADPTHPIQKTNPWESFQDDSGGW